MKRLLLIPLLFVLSAPLSGCLTIQDVVNGASLATASVSNPVTPDRLKAVEDGATVAFAALGAYKRVCISRTIPQSCRTVIRQIQVYTRQLPPALVELRAFVRNNDQVNAIIVYNSVQQLITGFKSVAANNNIPVGAI